MSSHDYIQASFEKICTEASSLYKKEPPRFFVTLYERIPFYGGPEEGGWWGIDAVIVSSQEFSSYDEALAVHDNVQRLAKELTESSRIEFQQRMSRETDWLDARGLDSDYLPEPDGESSFFVVVEKQRGYHSRMADRQYS